MAGWTNIVGLLNDEQIQLIEEGAQPQAAAAAVAEARRRLEAGASETDIWAAVSNVPRRGDFPFNEPSDLPGIQALRKNPVGRFNLDPAGERFADQMYGAWLGRCAGCVLGKPVETFGAVRNGLSSWERQKVYLSAISPDEWPLRDYVPQTSPGIERSGKVNCLLSTREQVAFVETDDDIRYTVLGQLVMRRHGKGFTSRHVAHLWLEQLGYWQFCTAERQAYRNLIALSDDLEHVISHHDHTKAPSESDWDRVRLFMNPYREWIGAQIRVDSYGYAAAGDPQLAADFAWRDARISHVKNGIYGAMFCAAMIAASFATTDPMRIVEAGLSQIPASSRLYADVRQTIELCARYGTDFARFENLIRDLHGLLGHYHFVHTNNNAAACVAALLLSGGDFHKAITFAVMAGWDTDCNGATVGSIVGAIAGASRVPEHWKGRLNDTLQSLVIDYHPIKISECARRSVEIAKQVAE